MEIILIGLIFELIIISISIIVLVLIFKKYIEKRQNLTLLLFLIFLSFTIAILFSCLSKALRIFSGLEYLTNPKTSDPATLESWFFLRIVDFRFTFLFLAFGTLLSYHLYVNLFEKTNFIQKVIVYCYGIFTMIFNLLVYEKGNALLWIIAVCLTAVYLFMIYIPFMMNCIKSYRVVDEKNLKNAFLSLIIMSSSIVLILIFQLIDRLFIIFLNSPGFTIFYFMGWLCAVIAIIATYSGYIRPKVG